MSFTKNIMLRSVLAGVSMLGATMVAAAPVNINGGFESETPEWKFWVPKSSEGINASFERVTSPVHSGNYAARLSSEGGGRYAIGNNRIRVRASEGQRYRVSFWTKTEPGAEVSRGHPGPMVRILLRDPKSKDVSAGNFFIGADGIVNLGTSPARRNTVKLPTEWTKTEVIIEMPEGVTSFHPEVFGWGMKGTMYIDDFEIEEVPAETQLTPLASASGGNLPSYSQERVTEIAALLSEEPVFFCLRFLIGGTGTASAICLQAQS